MNFRSLIPFGREGQNFLDSDIFQRRMNRMFEEMFQSWGPNNEQFLQPRMDIQEKEGSLEITAELPGVDEKDIEVELVNNVLTIRGEKRREHKEENKNYQLMERSFGSFQRHIPLPWQAEPDSIQAEFEKGVLHVFCKGPPEASEKAKKIPISGTKPQG